MNYLIIEIVFHVYAFLYSILYFTHEIETINCKHAIVRTAIVFERNAIFEYQNEYQANAVHKYISSTTTHSNCTLHVL